MGRQSLSSKVLSWGGRHEIRFTPFITLLYSALKIEVHANNFYFVFRIKHGMWNSLVEHHFYLTNSLEAVLYLAMILTDCLVCWDVLLVVVTWAVSFMWLNFQFSMNKNIVWSEFKTCLICFMPTYYGTPSNFRIWLRPDHKSNKYKGSINQVI